MTVKPDSTEYLYDNNTAYKEALMTSSTPSFTGPPHPAGQLLPFHTSRLILRAATSHDVPNCLARAMDPECVKHLQHLNHKNHTAESCQKWIDFMAKERHENGGLWIIVERIEDGKVIGDGGIAEQFWEDAAGKRYDAFQEGLGLRKIGDGGLMLASGPDIRGRGYADEAMYGVLSMAFEGGPDGKGQGLNEARACTDQVNEPMRKLGRRLHMRESDHVSPKGTKYTQFELTRDEYEQGRKKGLWDFNAVNSGKKA